MKKLLLIVLAAFIGLTACQETNFGPSVSPENGVLYFNFHGQNGNAAIKMVPVFDTINKNTIVLSLKAGTDFKNVKLDSLVLSPGAKSSLNVGDSLDVTKQDTFTVTAPNGFVRTFYIIPPTKFNVKTQGPLMTVGVNTLTLGEWLCFGQNRKFDIDPVKNDSVGFFRCTSVVNTAPVVDNTLKVIYLNSLPIDKDDYFIFRSDGTYEFSYGKDGQSSSLTGNPVYRLYLMPKSKGSWQVVQSMTQGSKAAASWGVSLQDDITGKTILFNTVNISDTNLVLVAWPLNNSSIRVRYVFLNSEADADWSQWIVN